MPASRAVTARIGHDRPLVVAIVGPTCTGKTALSLSLAQSLPVEIVACDSRTVYRHMDIGTAKPTAAERAVTCHHMIDVASPDEVFTVAQYKQEAGRIIEEITARGRLPLVVGGTGFYARALLQGLQIPAVAPQPELRARLREQAEKEGNQALHRRLQELDPASAERISTNDLFRIVRALEVSIVCGRPFSELAEKVEPAYNTLWIGLTANNRSIIHQAIGRRFQIQMEQGMLAEVEELLSRYGPCRSIMGTVNYRELALYLQGLISRREAEQQCVQHNIQLTRRQLTWFRANPEISWLAIDELTDKELTGRVLALIDSKTT